MGLTGQRGSSKAAAREGRSAESKDRNGERPLSWAAEKGHEIVVRLLLEKGEELESRDKDGRTLLLCAGTNGQEAAVKLLLDKAVDVNSKDEGGQTPLSQQLGITPVLSILSRLCSDIYRSLP